MSLPPKGTVFFFVFSVLLGVATIWGITSANSGIQGKFEPWLWDKIQELEANGTSRMISLIIILVDNPTSLKNSTAELLVKRHGAEDVRICSSPGIIAKVNSTEVKTIAAYDFVELLGDGERKFSFSIVRAKLRDPIWNLSRGTVDFLLCNEGTLPFTIIEVTIDGNEANMYPSSVSLSRGEKAKITIYYPFEPNHKYTFILLDEIGHMFRSFHLTSG